MAAVCIWPAFVHVACEVLSDADVLVATVANFPDGAADPEAAAEETAMAVEAGADEVDVVWPYRVWLEGEREQAQRLVAACKSSI